MTKTVDMKALVAHLTETNLSKWEPYMGRKEGIGTEETFIEIGDFGPWDEDVAEMVREGYTSGQRWSLKTEIDLEENEPAALEIARLIAEGCTCGHGLEEFWEVEMHKTYPREVYVCIDDEDIVVRVTETDGYEAINFETTISELEADTSTARFVRDIEQPPRP
ncbi:hypothetical protein G6L37_34695 [Agrobacterium rubi]|nr:hypothetical protein [Agrobacterium rubi]NTF23717.1 hypothetical protein [Agrobacterium rubi]